MKDNATISRNTSKRKDGMGSTGNTIGCGGGVWLGEEATFVKTGGIIYGYNTGDPDDVNANRVMDDTAIATGRGHAIAIYSDGGNGTMLAYKDATVSGNLSYKGDSDYTSW